MCTCFFIIFWFRPFTGNPAYCNIWYYDEWYIFEFPNPCLMFYVQLSFLMLVITVIYRMTFLKLLSDKNQNKSRIYHNDIKIRFLTVDEQLMKDLCCTKTRLVFCHPTVRTTVNVIEDIIIWLRGSALCKNYFSKSVTHELINIIETQ